MHASFMRRCLELAEFGRGKVSPNPLVGCVITDAQGNILGEGWHEEFGEKHAEVITIESVGARHALPLPQEATLYVNLEPCSHHGKQPPCTEAIIKAGIKKVVFGARDPLHGGSAALRSRGIEVIGPVLETECRRFNKGFFSLVEQGRPWVTLKKAIRPDGSTDGKITSEEQDHWSHTYLRATHDAILVGSGTIIADNPQLNVRFSVGAWHAVPPPHPRRIILDHKGEVPSSAKVLTDADSGRTILIREQLPIPLLLEHLQKEGITSVLVEGGPTVWQRFEESGCIDETIYLVGK